MKAVGRQALSELENDWQPLRSATRAIDENVAFLEKKMTGLPQPPTTIADVALAQEIRQHMKAQKSPIDFAMQSISEPRTLGAILSAPAYLSGLSDSEWDVVREKARRTLHPEQVEMQQQLTRARDDLRAGVDAAKRMVKERCKIIDLPEHLLAKPAFKEAKG